MKKNNKLDVLLIGIVLGLTIGFLFTGLLMYYRTVEWGHKSLLSEEDTDNNGWGIEFGRNGLSKEKAEKIYNSKIVCFR